MGVPDAVNFQTLQTFQTSNFSNHSNPQTLSNGSETDIPHLRDSFKLLLNFLLNLIIIPFGRISGYNFT